MRLLTKFVLLITFFLSGLLAGVPFAFAENKMSAEEQRHYYLTYESCKLFMADRSPKGAILSALNPQALDVMFGTLGDVNYMMGKYFDGDSHAFDRLVDNKGLGTYIQQLLQSDGFMLALQDCFPDQRKRNAYVFNLLVLDGTAKFVLTAGTMIGYFRFLKWSYAYIHSPWVKALFLTHVATIMTGDAQVKTKRLADMMAEQYNDLSSQVEALINKQKP